MMVSSKPIFFDSLLCFAFGFLRLFCFAVYIMNYCRVKQHGFCEKHAKLSCKTSCVCEIHVKCAQK